jgi:hypothetical protein
MRKLMNLVAKLSSPGRRHESAPSAHQQRITYCRPQPHKRSAHRRRTQAEAAGRPGNAPFCKQNIEREKKIEVELFHG